MRRHLTAIVGLAFCAGALTAVWAARPWERARAPSEASSPAETGRKTDAPVGARRNVRETAAA